MKRKRNKKFNFPRAKLPRKTILEPYFCKNGKPVANVFWKREGEQVFVADDDYVCCDGILIEFSKLTGLILDKLGTRPPCGYYQPSRYWKYQGEKLSKRYERICILRAAQREGVSS